MLPSEIPENFNFPPENPLTPFPENFCMIQSFNFNGGFSYTPSHEISPSPSSLAGSTSDEGDDRRLKIIDDRKQRRMISNRESARRSRMRKQKHLNELWSQVSSLCSENHDLIQKMNRLVESQELLLQENERLREEASGFRRMISDLQMGSPYTYRRELDGNSGDF